MESHKEFRTICATEPEQEIVSAIRGFDEEETDILTEALGAFQEKANARRAGIAKARGQNVGENAN